MATPYMSLDLPVVTVTLGPTWATMLNTALTSVDDHDHTSGKGRLITPSALNINADVAMGDNNLSNTKSVRLANQAALLTGGSDLRALYAFGGELYYRDASGNQVKITNAGSINATAVGGIGGDYTSSTASVVYSSVSKTFTFTQNTNQSAKLDIGDIILRETVAAANAITIKSPASLASSYSLTLPTALPAANKLLQMSTTGAVSAEYVTTSHIDPSGLGAAAYAALSVGTAALANDSVTSAKLDPNASIVKITKQVFNSGAGTYPLIVPTGVERIIFYGCGGGGGGGGGSAGVTAPGGGGGAGAEVRTVAVNVSASVAQTFATTDVDIGTEIITVTGHGYSANQAVNFTSTGTLPGGLSSSNVYYVRDVTTNTFKVSSTIGGSAVDLTSVGSGTHTVQNCIAIVIGAGGSGGASGANGTRGSTTYVRTGNTILAYFPGGAGGSTGDDASDVGGAGGADNTWDNRSTPGGKGSSQASANAVAGSAPINASGTGGAAASNIRNGGGGGGAIGNGANGGAPQSGTAGLPGDAAASASGAGGGGGAGVGEDGSISGAGGNGGSGYMEAIYWENAAT